MQVKDVEDLLLKLGFKRSDFEIKVQDLNPPKRGENPLNKFSSPINDYKNPYKTAWGVEVLSPNPIGRTDTSPIKQEDKDGFKMWALDRGIKILKQELLRKQDSSKPTGGVKESDGKLSYELDWMFIDAMARRMSKNKSKYGPYNWQKPMDIEKLKQAMFRHVISVMNGDYEDEGVANDHLVAIALNAMFINYQLNKK